MNDKQRYQANEEPLAEQTMRVLESQTNGSGSQDDQVTAELGRLLRDAAKANLPESNVDLREQLMAQLDGGSTDEQRSVVTSKATASKLASESTGHRRFWIAAAASGLLLVGGAIAYNSGFVGELSNVAVLEPSSKPESHSAVPARASSVVEQTPKVVFKYETKTRAVPVQKTRTETKTRMLPVSRYREETKRVKQADGSFKEQKVKVPYTENVTQNYTVQVPYTENVAQSYTVPVPYTADGKRIEEADYGKYGLGSVSHFKAKYSAPSAIDLLSKMSDKFNKETVGQGQWSKDPSGSSDGQSESFDEGLPAEPSEPQSDLFNMAGEAFLKKPSDQIANGIVGQFSGQAGPGDVADEQLFESPDQAHELNIDGVQSGGQGLPVDAMIGRLAIAGAPNAVEDGRKEAQRQLAVAIREAYVGGRGDKRRGRGGRRPAEWVSGGELPESTRLDLGLRSKDGRSQGFPGSEMDIHGRFLPRGEHSYPNEQILEEKRIIDALELQRDQLVVARSLGPGHVDISALALAIEERKQKLEALIRGERNTGEQYEPIFENAFIAAKGPETISTFSIDVDTASYANMRRLMNSGQRPPANSIRLEELVNYFQYGYKQPTGEHPFSVNLDLADCPWQDGHQLLRVGLKGKDVHVAERPATNVVFLIDVSGSMSSSDKLPLLKSGFQMMSQQLGENDRVSIVTYAGNAGVVLTPTNGTQTQTINNAIERLSSGGSTHGSAGIKLAYQLAQQNFIEGGVNRVMLATDGDLNVGVTSDDALVSLIKEKASEGVFLTVLGFGTGNLKDGKLEKLADNGNGMYAYIDSTREARRVLVDQLSGSLVTIAKDVKIQVEFNPAEVKSYRLLGYENRMLETKDFDDDRKDAGEIGAGHTVTAIYQIEPAKAVKRTVALSANMKYQVPADVNSDEPVDGPGDAGQDGLSKQALSGDLATVALRYKEPEASESVRLEVSIKNEPKRFEEASDDFRFAASVAGFGMYLRNSKHRGTINAALLQRIASGAIGSDESGYRSEFIDLIRKASGR